MVASLLLVYILRGLWEINTAAAKVALTEADVICFTTNQGDAAAAAAAGHFLSLKHRVLSLLAFYGSNNKTFW